MAAMEDEKPRKSHFVHRLKGQAAKQMWETKELKMDHRSEPEREGGKRPL